MGTHPLADQVTMTYGKDVEAEFGADNSALSLNHIHVPVIFSLFLSQRRVAWNTSCAEETDRKKKKKSRRNVLEVSPTLGLWLWTRTQKSETSKIELWTRKECSDLFVQTCQIQRSDIFLNIIDKSYLTNDIFRGNLGDSPSFPFITGAWMWFIFHPISSSGSSNSYRSTSIESRVSV